MSTQITTAMVKQYSGNVEYLVQQKGSRLRESVDVETGIRGKEAFFDQIGVAPAPTMRTTRHADTPLMETPHARRRCVIYPYDWADLIDDPDKIRTLIDPQSAYAKAAAWAMSAAMDDVIIAAANGTAYTGVDGGTGVALPSAQKIAVGSAGLTIAKLRSAKEILDAAEVDPEEPRFVWLSAKQVTNLLATTEVTSSDYNTVKALVQGEINTFLGFKFIRTERLGLVTTLTRAVIAMAKGGVKLAVGEDIKGKITERDDKNYSTQVWYHMDIGATRMQEEKVVEIACLES
jgi:hypothetical protein